MTQLLREATQQEAQEKTEFLKGIPDDDLEEIVMESFPKPSTILKAGLCPFLLGDELKSTKLWPFNDGGFTVICEDANQTLPRMPANAYRYVAGRLLPPVPNVGPPVIPDASQVNGEELKRGKLWPFLFGGESSKLPTMPATAHRYFAGRLLPPVPCVPPPLVPCDFTLPTRKKEKSVRFCMDDVQVEAQCSSDGMCYVGSDGISRKRRFPVPDERGKSSSCGRYLGCRRREAC